MSGAGGDTLCSARTRADANERVHPQLLDRARVDHEYHCRSSRSPPSERRQPHHEWVHYSWLLLLDLPWRLRYRESSRRLLLSRKDCGQALLATPNMALDGIERDIEH